MSVAILWKGWHVIHYTWARNSTQQSWALPSPVVSLRTPRQSGTKTHASLCRRHCLPQLSKTKPSFLCQH